MEKFLNYLQRHGDDMLEYFLEHLQMCGTAIIIGFFIAMMISIILLKIRFLKKPVIAVLGALYAIPSMAFFAMLVPFFGLGMKDAVIVLTVYCQFILVRNIVAGFQGIDPLVLEAAKGMGMNPVQVFWRVQLPLALPVIVSGIRIAIIVTIGSGIIAQTVNAGGLGVLIFDGLRTMNNVKMIWGTLLIAILAITVNFVLGRVEKYTLKRAQGLC